MSVFLKNDCQYANCNKVFPTLHELIIHIENKHIDFNPAKIEQIEKEKPDSLSLSYILKYSNNIEPSTRTDVSTTEEKRQSFNSNRSVIETNSNGHCIHDCDHKKNFSHVIINNNTPSSRLPVMENAIVPKFLNEHHYLFENGHKKPFICTIPGCCKRYKNVNGVKYHYKNFHRFSTPVGKRLIKSSSQHHHKINTMCNLIEKRNNPVLNLPSSTPNICSHINNNINMFNRVITPSAPNLHGDRLLDILTNDHLYNFTTTSNELNVPINQVPLPNRKFNKYYGLGSINNYGYESKFQPNINSSNHLPNNSTNNSY